MIGYPQAIQVVLAQTVPADPVQLPLEECLGLTLAATVAADLDFPPFDRASVDGYAVRAADLADGPAELAVLGEQAAGVMPTLELADGATVRVQAGAALPRGADAVVPLTEAGPAGNGHVRIAGGAAAGANVLPRGSDAQRGEVVLSPGTRLTPARLAAAASVECVSPWVYPRPRVALLSVGDELIHFSQTPALGQVRDSAGPALAAAIARFGTVVADDGLCPANLGRLEKRVTALLAENDVVVLTGGATGGWAELASRLGGIVRFDGVAIEPGGPALLATVDEKSSGPAAVGATDPSPQRPRRRYVLALGGGPTGALVGWLTLGTVLLGRLMGRATVRPATVLAMADAPVRPAGDSDTFVPAVLRPADRFTAWRVEPVEARGGAGDVFALARANALIVRPAGAGELARRAVCEVMPLDPMLPGMM